MKEVLKTEVPSYGENAMYNNAGQLVSYHTQTERVVYIGHETIEMTMHDHGMPEVETYVEPKTELKTFAFEIRIPKPVTRARAITAAEMSAYGLITPLDVASFNAGLSRKQREGVDQQEITDHDEFIAWVKDELTKLGI